MIRHILVLGGGSAGLLAAVSLKIKLPALRITLLRSPSIGIIGVGEGTTPNFPAHLFDYLGIRKKSFFEKVRPTWKLGVRFLWGRRGRFDYSFGQQCDATTPGLARPNGYFCDEEFESASLPAALMRQDRVFRKRVDGLPDIQGWHAFHLENELLVTTLEEVAREVGVEIIEGEMREARRSANGDVSSLLLEDGRVMEGDFFIDASGFRSELMGRVLEEPFVDFGASLFCDRALAAGWERQEGETILPYTTAEAMDAGWAWQIEHERHVNRGYVFSSSEMSDDQACAEFLRKNPRIKREPRLVKFRSGYHRRQWVGNVVTIGNSGGFVEPLEATALMIVCGNVQMLIEMLTRSEGQPGPAMRDLFNRMTERSWLDIRDFLALHYKLNTAGQTSFWRKCREETDVSRIQDLLDFYRENGPTGFCRYFIDGAQKNDFGLEGYLVMLIGNKTPYRNAGKISLQEMQLWQHHRTAWRGEAARGMTVNEALEYVHHPNWVWDTD